MAIANFAKSIDSQVTVAKAAKPNLDRPEFYHVELKLGNLVVYGELTIMDFLATEKNR